MQYCKNRLNMNVANTSDKQTKDDLNTGKIELQHPKVYNNTIAYETIDNSEPLDDLSNVLSITYSNVITTVDNKTLIAVSGKIDRKKHTRPIPQVCRVLR